MLLCGKRPRYYALAALNTASDIPPSRPDATENVPATPAPAIEKAAPVPARAPDPTRYGDWEKNGRCIDF